ncbi:MAG: extracellular solute-binding protein [Deltaproteobacteria bacterium]|nr:extracellular solute-binding protein [Deltaproteobacteria bacterium]
MKRRHTYGLAILIAAGAIFMGSMIGLTEIQVTVAAMSPAVETEKQKEARLIESAKKEGKVIFWNQGQAKEMQPVLAKFRQRYPFLQVDYWRADESVLREKLLSEARARVYNVDVSGAEIDFILELKKAGLMKKYDWPNTRDWSPQHKDREGYWIARNILPTVAAYNTNLVSPAEAPKGWEDFLNPKWKGSISMDRAGGEWVLMLWAAWGKEKTTNYLRTLAKNNLVLATGATARTEMLAAGAYKMDLRLNLNRILDYQEKGAPMEWVRTDPIVMKGTPIFIAERAPHPNAALLFADWFTSLEGQQAYYEASGKLLPEPRIKSRMTEALKGQKVVLFPAEMAVHGNEADNIFRDLFLK